MLERCLIDQEKIINRQNMLRKIWGVKEVNEPTYNKYITGEVKRFHSQNNIFAAMKPSNPVGYEVRKRHLEITGSKYFSMHLPYCQMEPAERIHCALDASSWRICASYNPDPVAVTAAEGRVSFESPLEASLLIKKIAMWFGAEMVKIAKLDQRWVYEDIEISHPYVIVCVVPHDLKMNRTAPSFLSGAAVSNTYARLKVITSRLSDFIRLLGYDALMRETLGMAPELLMVPIAIDAGVGEFCRTGRVMSPEWGNNMRLKAVTTNLPLHVDKPISFNAHRFCTSCKNCAKYCPSGAVPRGEPQEAPKSIWHNPGYKKWYIKADRCLFFWGKNRRKWITCGGRCISVCPWNKPHNWFHHLVRAIATRSPKWLVKILVWGDRITERRNNKVRGSLKSSDNG